jgi:conjugative relaxase-like TrwC/TraI family protein
VLSISPPIHSANYYLNLAREDYFIQGREPHGQWRGEAASALALSGAVEKSALRALFAGMSPDGRIPLVQNAGSPSRQSGWDLTFSAPKSVSVLWSQAPEEIRRSIQAAHQAAVDRCLQFLEERAAFTRRGKGGDRIEPAKVLYACFEHGVSRAHDPQLHTHCLLLNLSLRMDGSTGSLVSAEFFRNKMVGGALYRAELAHQLAERLGLRVENTAMAFAVKDVPDRLCDKFSKRRQQILCELARQGYSSAKAAKIATLDTRDRKVEVPRDELFKIWKEAGNRLGFGENQAKALVEAHRATPQPAYLHDLRSTLLRLQPEVQTEKKLLLIACRIAQERGLSATEVLSAVSSCLKDQRKVQVRHKHPFWKAPAWSPARKLKLSYLAFSWQRAKRRFGRTLAQQATPFGKLSIREKFLFPNAPRWSPIRRLKLPALDLRKEAPPVFKPSEEKKHIYRRSR